MLNIGIVVAFPVMEWDKVEDHSAGSYKWNVSVSVNWRKISIDLHYLLSDWSNSAF